MPISPLLLLIAGLVLAFGLGFWFAPREQLDTDVAHEGIFTTDTKRVLSAAVQSLAVLIGGTWLDAPKRWAMARRLLSNGIRVGNHEPRNSS